MFLMGVRRVYIESGVTERGHIILEEFTNDVLLMANLLKDVSANLTDEFVRKCNQEGDTTQSMLIMPFPATHGEPPRLSYQGYSDFVVDEAEIDDDDCDDEEIIDEEDGTPNDPEEGN